MGTTVGAETMVISGGSRCWSNSGGGCNAITATGMTGMCLEAW